MTKCYNTSQSSLLPLAVLDNSQFPSGSASTESVVFDSTTVNPVTGILTVNHNLNSVLLSVEVFKPTAQGIYELIYPNRIIVVDNRTVRIDLEHFPVTNGWLVLLTDRSN